MLGNAVVTTGGYGVTVLEFPSDKVAREQDRMTLSCQLDWVEATTLPSTVLRVSCELWGFASNATNCASVHT